MYFMALERALGLIIVLFSDQAKTLFQTKRNEVKHLSEGL